MLKYSFGCYIPHFYFFCLSSPMYDLLFPASLFLCRFFTSSMKASAATPDKYFILFFLTLLTFSFTRSLDLTSFISLFGTFLQGTIFFLCRIFHILRHTRSLIIFFILLFATSSRQLFLYFLLLFCEIYLDFHFAFLYILLPAVSYLIYIFHHPRFNIYYLLLPARIFVST